MARRWQVRRTTTAHGEGQHRWDLAYQSLLQWTDGRPPQSSPFSRADQRADQREEETHGGGPVRAGLDPTPAADPDH